MTKRILTIVAALAAVFHAGSAVAAQGANLFMESLDPTMPDAPASGVAYGSVEPDHLREVFKLDNNTLDLASIKGNFADQLLVLTMPARFVVRVDSPTRQIISCDTQLDIFRTAEVTDPGLSDFGSWSQIVMVNGDGGGMGAISHRIDPETGDPVIRSGPIHTLGEDEEPLTTAPADATEFSTPWPGCSMPSMDGMAAMMQQMMQAGQAGASEGALEAMAMQMAGALGGGMEECPSHGVVRVTRMRDARLGWFRADMVSTTGNDVNEDCVPFSGAAVLSLDGVEPDDEPEQFALLSHEPEAMTLTLPAGKGVVECTNNDFRHPLVRMAFSTPLDRRTIADNIRLEILSGGQWSEYDGVSFAETMPGLVEMTASAPLLPSRKYRVRIDPGLRSEDDLKLGETEEFTFNTAPSSAGDREFPEYLTVDEIGIYQVSRDAPLVPGKETASRTWITYAPEKDQVDEVCLTVSMFQIDKGQRQKVFADTDYVSLPRRRLGEDQIRKGALTAINSGWTPGMPGSATDYKFSAEVSLYNFTSTDPGEVRVTLDKPEPVAIHNEAYAATYRMIPIVLQNTRDELLGSDNLKDLLLDKARRVQLTVDYPFRTPSLAAGIRRASPYASVNFERGAAYPFSLKINSLYTYSSETKIASLYEAEFWAMHKRYPPSCPQGIYCVLVAPFDLGQAAAAGDAGTGGRAIIFGPDTLEAPLTASKIEGVFLHEAAHTRGLFHSPSTRLGRTYILDAIDKFEPQGQVRWEGIDAVRIMEDGTVATMNSDEGNALGDNLFPVMFPSTKPLSLSAFQKDAYEHFLHTLLIGMSDRFPRFYEPTATNTAGGQKLLNEANWLKVRSDYDSARGYDVGVLDFVDASAEPQPGLVVSFSLDREGGVPFLPTVTPAEAGAFDVSALEGEVLTLSLTGADGAVLASSDAVLPEAGEEDGTDIFSVIVFLPYDGETDGGTLVLTSADGETLFSMALQ